LNKKEAIEPKEYDFEEMERIMNNIKTIVSGNIPLPIKRKICKKCSYYEFCFGGEG
jgi:CRISPR-associated exonuclease Cas4